MCTFLHETICEMQKKNIFGKINFWQKKDFIKKNVTQIHPKIRDLLFCWCFASHFLLKNKIKVKMKKTHKEKWRQTLLVFVTLALFCSRYRRPLLFAILTIHGPENRGKLWITREKHGFSLYWILMVLVFEDTKFYRNVTPAYSGGNL